MSLGGKKSQSTTDVRLNGITVNQSSYGNAIPLVYGTNRIGMTLLWYGNFIATPHTQTQAGGKGGGGASSNTTFTYSASMVLGLCEGSLAAPIVNIYQDKVVTNNFGAAIWVQMYGAGGQAPWAYLTTNFPAQAVPYDHTAYVGIANYDFGGSAAIPNFTFEVTGLVPYQLGTINDAEPSDILMDYCTEPNHGCNFNALGTIQGVGATFESYCIAMNFFISPYEATQRPAIEFIKEILQITNSGAFTSAGTLNILPYADSSVTGNGRTYTPNLAPLFAFTEDDLMAGTGSTGSDPIMVNRKPLADTYNTVRVEYLDRSHAYNIAIAEATDAQDIALNGVRVMSTLSFHSITSGSVAQNVAQLILQRQLYVRSEFTFAVRADYCLLEPMDLVSLTDSSLGFVNKLVRLTQVADDQNDFLTMTAEDMLVGTASAPIYNYQAAQGYADNWGIAPPSIGTPLIFVAPPMLVSENGGYEIWCAIDQGVAGSWGGADVYTSLDNVSYILVGTINGAARYGALTAALPSHADPDTADTLQVALTNPTTTPLQLVSGSAADYANLRTLIYVDAEIMAYQTATLTSAGHYNLNNLRRGLYGSTIASQPLGGTFARIDAGIFRIRYDVGMTGQTAYFKFCSFNAYGKGHQALNSVTAYPYLIQNNNAGQLQPGALTLVGNNVTTSGPTAFKSSGAASAWDASVFSDQPYLNGCAASCYIGQTNGLSMLGLSTNALASDSFTNLAYALYPYSDGTLQIYEAGSYVGNFGTYTTNTLLAIVYDGKHVAYYVDGGLIRTVPLASAKFFLQICINTLGSSVYGIDFQPVTTATATLSLINFNAGSACTGTRATKISNANGTWDTAVSSKQSYKNGCALSFNIIAPGGSSMCGLTDTPLASANYPNLDYAFSLIGTNAYVYESGVQVIYVGVASSATLFSITYDGVHVAYYIDGVLVRTVPTADRTFFAQACMAYIGDQVVNIDFGALASVATPYTLVPLTNNVVCHGTTVATNALGAANTWGVRNYQSAQSYNAGAIVSFSPLNSVAGTQLVGMWGAPIVTTGNPPACWVLTATSSQCYLFNTIALTIAGVPLVSDVFTLSYDNYFWYWYKNGVQVHQESEPSIGPLYLYGDIETLGVGVRKLSFAPFGKLSPNPWVASGLNAVTHDSSCSKIGGVAAWDSSVYSLNAYKTCHLHFKVNPLGLAVMVGLTTTPPSISGNNSYTTNAYSWYSTNSSVWAIYEGGVSVASYGAALVTDLAAITYDGATVTYWLNGISKRTVAIAGKTFYANAAFNAVGATINNLVFGPGAAFELTDTAQLGVNAATSLLSKTTAASQNIPSASGFVQIMNVTLGPFAYDATVVFSAIGTVNFINASGSAAGLAATLGLANNPGFSFAAQCEFVPVALIPSGSTLQYGYMFEGIFTLLANTITSYYLGGVQSGGGAGLSTTTVNTTIKAEVIKR